jgi:hypothetical protein
MLTIDKINVKGLVNNKDFEVVTIELTTRDYDIVPLGRIFKNSITPYIEKDRNESLVDVIKKELPKGYMVMTTKPFGSDVEVDLYHLKDGMVDFNTAMDCGFGIIRMLEGEYQGEYFLYNIANDEEDLPLILDIYLQLVVVGYKNDKLKDFVSTSYGKKFINALQSSEGANLYRRLQEKFTGKTLH